MEWAYLDASLDRLSVNPGDILVFTCHQHLTPDQSAEIRDGLQTQLRQRGRDNLVLVLSNTAELHVLTTDMIEIIASAQRQAA